MNWIETEQRAVVNAVMNVQFRKFGEFLDWGPVVFSWSTVLHDIALIQQCRLLAGRKQFPAELTTLPSCYRICSSAPSVNIPLSSQIYYVTSNQWSCQCHVATNIDLLLYTKSRAVSLPAFHCEGLRSTPSRFMYEPWCSNSSTNCLQRTHLNFTSHLLCLCVSDVSSCWFSVQTVR